MSEVDSLGGELAFHGAAVFTRFRDTTLAPGAQFDGHLFRQTLERARSEQVRRAFEGLQETFLHGLVTVFDVCPVKPPHFGQFLGVCGDCGRG